jgi:hypothetical protein
MKSRGAWGLLPLLVLLSCQGSSDLETQRRWISVGQPQTVSGDPVAAPQDVHALPSLPSVWRARWHIRPAERGIASSTGASRGSLTS